MWTTIRLTELEGGDVAEAVLGMDGGTPSRVFLTAPESWEIGDELDWPTKEAIAQEIHRASGVRVELVGYGIGGADEDGAHMMEWPLRVVEGEMGRYRITSTGGADYGIWEGASEADALAALHRDAGYECRVEGGRIVFADETAERGAGQVEDWIVREAEEGEEASQV